MFLKLFKLIYLLVVLAVGILALALGAANSGEVTINLWAVKVNTSLAAVISVAAVVGALFISMCWFYVYLKQRLINAQLKRRLKKFETTAADTPVAVIVADDKE